MIDNISKNTKKSNNLLLFLERKKKYLKIDKNYIIKVSLQFIEISEKTKDLRYLNLALKVRDRFKKHKLLDYKIKKLMKKIS